MTTQVTITKTDTGNHDDVMVDVLNGDGDYLDSHRLVEEGDSIELYVYDTQTLAVREVPKE